MNEKLRFKAQPIFYDNGSTAAIFLQIPTDKIVELNFLLESYDGLAIMRTLDATRGEVVVLTPVELINTVAEFIDSERMQLNILQIERPISLANDWLLGNGL